MNFTDFVFFAAVCAAVTAILCVKARPIGTRFRLMDVPDFRKKHRTETPLMGGVAVLVGLMPVAIVYTYFFMSERWIWTLSLWIICVGLMSLIGLADDRHSMAPRVRLVLSFVIFATVASIDPTFNIRLLEFEQPLFTLGLGTWWLAVIFTVICCVGLINAVNMADGKNGLVIGLCLGWLLLLAFRAPTPLLPIMGCLAAMLAVLLAFNLKGMLFLGDGGAYGVATAIGLLAIIIYNSPGAHPIRAVSAGELMVLFAVPVLDSFRLTYARLRRGQSPMTADRDHLHHHLQDKFGWPAGLIVYIAIAFIPAALVFYAL